MSGINHFKNMHETPDSNFNAVESVNNDPKSPMEVKDDEDDKKFPPPPAYYKKFTD